ncbi:NfeD family protein [Stygiolobus caldivivus]|uniref:Serine protease n=1 Tax=Stygiolobus caldivivus TaxID=2824673 RepID=A0A8D5U5D5_9CREN|nr:NfeD family protein [Stygiolobus caldivivus]BCU69322.1 serine protease [Stygiolobus caldivivus]
MVSHIAIPIILIVVVVLLLVITGQYSDPIVAVPSLAIVGFISYRVFYVVWKTKGRNLYTYNGKIGKALDDILPGKEGYILVEGERWLAISDEPIAEGEEVIVIGMENLKLRVKRYNRVRV